MKSLLKQGNTTGSAPLEVIDMKIVDNQNMQDQVIKGVYDNPDVALCRELICNMSDSHLAAGNPERPPVVTLPSKMEPYLTFRDFGKGMTHEEIKKVYSQIGMSDKRESGVQTGEKGLGAKSPLAYRDSFSLTCYDEDGYRAYSVCYSDERRAQVLLLAKGPNDGSTDPETGLEYPNEERGVEIVIAIKDGDIEAMTANVLNTIANFAHPFSNGVAKPVVSGMDSEAADAWGGKVLGTAVRPSSSRNAEEKITTHSLANSWDDAHMVTDYVGYMGDFNAVMRRSYHYRANDRASFFNANVLYDVKDINKLLKDDSEVKEFQAIFPLAMCQDHLVFFVPLLNEEDQLPYISTTAGRDTIQPHARTTAFLRKVLAEFESKMSAHLAERMLATSNYFEAFELIQEEKWFFNEDLSNKLNSKLSVAKDRVFPKFESQHYVWRGDDTYKPLRDTRNTLIKYVAEALSQNSGVKDIVAEASTTDALQWARISGNKAFTRHNTQKDFCSEMRNAGQLLVVDDSRNWKARVKQVGNYGLKEHAIVVGDNTKGAWMATAGAHPEYCVDHTHHLKFKEAVKTALGMFGIKPVFVSEMPKYTVVRHSSKSSAADKSATAVSNRPALRTYSPHAYKTTDKFRDMLDWDKAPQHVLDGNFIYVRLKGNNPILGGEPQESNSHSSEGVTSFTYCSPGQRGHAHKAAMLSSLGLELEEEPTAFPMIYFIRETEMPKGGMPAGAIEFDDWLAKEIVFMAPAAERYAMSQVLTSMMEDCDLTMTPVSSEVSGKNHCYKLAENHIGFVTAAHLRSSLKLLLSRQEPTEVEVYADRVVGLMRHSAFNTSKKHKKALEVYNSIRQKSQPGQKDSYYSSYTPVITGLLEGMPLLPLVAKMESVDRYTYNTAKRVTARDSKQAKKVMADLMKSRPWIVKSYCESYDSRSYWNDPQHKLVQKTLDCCTSQATSVSFVDKFPKLPRTKSRPGLKY